MAEADARSGKRTDVLLICGDFQAVRNDADMPCMAMPQKYWQLGTFSSSVRPVRGRADGPATTRARPSRHT